MKQTTLANNDFEQFRKPTRRERFLTEMNTVVPWADLAVIEPYYPKATKAGGRPPVGLERMLRTSVNARTPVTRMRLSVRSSTALG